MVVDSFPRMSPMKQTQSARVRFGDYELDVKAGELHRQGKGILLQEQSFRLLLALIEQAGEIATREDLKQRLWPNDTVVEFDQGINAAIKRLRRALDDSPEQPKYIETVTRRGYRFMVPVEWVSSSPEGEALAKEAEAQTQPTIRHGELIGKKVSHYRVLQVVGGGGMGVVYKAEDLNLGRCVALKFLPEELGAEAVALSRLQREARTASSLNHTNICSIYELGNHEGQPFIAMELLDGQSLRDYLASQSLKDDGSAAPIAVDQLFDIAIQICDGLEAAHEKGIIHRDIKPANIFITSKGVVKILDFGLAKPLQTEEEDAAEQDKSCTDSIDPQETAPLKFSRTGLFLGTAAYMSPEQVRGEKLDARTDLFSFGLVVYEMATGRQAVRGNTAAELHDAVLNRTPVSPRELNPELPPGLEELIIKALQKSRGVRYQSASEMQADLENLKQSLHLERRSQPGGVSGAKGIPSLLSRTFSWKRVSLIVAAGMLIAGIIIGILAVHHRRVVPIAHNSSAQDFNAMGKQVVQQLAARQFDKVEARFDSRMASGMPAGMLAQAWDDLVDGIGEFKSIKSSHLDESRGPHVVVVSCDFQYAFMDILVASNVQGQITDLNYVSPDSPLVSMQKQPQTTPTQSTSEKDFTEVGNQVVQQLAAGQFDKVEARFDSRMSSRMPVGKLSAAWYQLTIQLGSLRSISRTHIEEHEGFQIIVVTCEFKYVFVDIRIAMDSQGRIAGLFAVPAERNSDSGSGASSHPAK